MFSSKKKNGKIDRSKAYAYLPDFMFADWVNDYERWCVQLMYLVRDAIKDELPENAKPFFSDKCMADNANMFVMNEASIAMDTFLTNLDEADIKVPISLLEPLLAVAKYIVDYGTTKEQFDATCKRLLTNAKTRH
jgi:hypothetical protein